MSLIINHCSRCDGIVTLTAPVTDYVCPRCAARRERSRINAAELERLEAASGLVIRSLLPVWFPVPMGMDEAHDHRDSRRLRDYGKFGEPVRVLKGLAE